MARPTGAVDGMKAVRGAQSAKLNVLLIIRYPGRPPLSLNVVAGQLNGQKVATANGGLWTHLQVRPILKLSGRRRSSGKTTVRLSLPDFGSRRRTARLRAISRE